MYAVIKTGGKQYRVADGEKLKVEKLLADVDSELVIDQVLAVGNGDDIKLGSPLLAGASVKAKILSHGRAEKVTIFKLRRRKHYKKHQGHRQSYTEIQITSINA
ncbi:MAG: 50S ribosomal protein L21 [Betaproteobacteria bacterium RIFCSPLOWO2_02_FULL_62_17]|nr:MAG: 50S ribosomal protein L21 [Betaproteobacteria bacterium RIFCSPLOWO2_02_FULL_62_17]